MTVPGLAVCILLALVAGGCGGWCLREHTRHDQAMAAIATAYLAERNNLDAQTEQILADIERYKQNLKKKGPSKWKNLRKP